MKLKGLMNRLNLSLLVPAILLVFISFTLFISIDSSLFRSQLIFFIIALFFYNLFLYLDYSLFRFYSFFIYFVILVFLGILFVIGIEARGAVRWIDIFGLRIQFSEIFKPFFIIFIASYLSADREKSLDKFIKILLLFLPIFFLILRQPDLGNALIYLFVLLCMLFSYGFPLRYYFFSAAVVIVSLPLIYNLLHTYQKQRIENFLNNGKDPFGASYNAVQSMISVGSGGFMGKGLGQATQSILKFLPERHTDFIFATLTESFGLLGAAVLLALYIYILYRIYTLSKYAQDTYTHLVITGFYFLLISHAFINIGMNIGILPIVGITLPFVSYGGSSLLTNFISLGILSSIAFTLKRTRSYEIS